MLCSALSRLHHPNITKLCIRGINMAMGKVSKKIVAPSEENLQLAGKRLRDGKLVAFPTETVYGLGANALDKDAVLKIFAAKGRPLTDPLIVHVTNMEVALDLVEFDGNSRKIFQYLASRFWPGPLTLIGKVSSHMPPELTAGTGYLGLRCPSKEVAKKLLTYAGVPVAAPSANKFGHVSPTTAKHVLDDLGDEDVIILDGGKCEVGIESTVLKIDESKDGKELIIYRKGGVSQQELELALEEGGLSGYTKIILPSKHKAEEETTSGLEAPGQLLTHYAPNLNTWLLDDNLPDKFPTSFQNGMITLESQNGRRETLELQNTVVIDFCASLKAHAHRFKDYRDLSEKGDVKRAAERLYDTLRWSENVAGAANLLLVNITPKKSMANHEHVAAIADKLYRAASGKLAAKIH